MSQYHQEQYYGQPGVDPYQQPQGKLSALAVASLVCSIICCIPVTTILGVLLGIGALISIGSNPMKRGKGIAIAGIILGLAFTAGQALIGLQMYRVWEVWQSAAYVALSPGFAGDYTTMRTTFSQAGTDDEAKAFIDELRDRYGELRASEVRFSDFSSMQKPQPGQTVVKLPWVLIFDQARVRAELTLDQRNPAQGDKMLFMDITVIDPSLGDLTFPPDASSGSTSRSGTPPDTDADDAADESSNP